MSLLSRARQIENAHRKSHQFTAEELELVEAWLDDKVQLKQCMEVMKYKFVNQWYTFAAFGAREIWRRNSK